MLKLAAKAGFVITGFQMNEFGNLFLNFPLRGFAGQACLEKRH